MQHIGNTRCSSEGEWLSQDNKELSILKFFFLKCKFHDDLLSSLFPPKRSLMNSMGNKDQPHGPLVLGLSCCLLVSPVTAVFVGSAG